MCKCIDTHLLLTAGAQLVFSLLMTFYYTLREEGMLQ